MDTWVWVLIVVAVALVLAVAAWAALRARRTRALHDTFGPEYERTVADAPTKREAEAELLERQKRHEAFELRPLPAEARTRYLQTWEATQARFVDDPKGAIEEADALIQAVMRERGYPVEDFEQRASDLSVDHPDVVENYRAAHTVAARSADGEVETEDLRQAMMHYRSLFEDLLEARRPAERTS